MENEQLSLEPESPPAIQLQDVYKKLSGKPILQGVNLTVHQGETYVIIGRSGTGKSVTLKNIVGLMRPDQGTISVMNQNLATMNKAAFYRLREDIGFLFQSGALLNWLNVEQNVALPLQEHRRELSPQQIQEIVKEKLALVDLLEIEHKMPAELSGGMKKRVALARAIVRNPKIIIYDEPTTGLDPVMSNQINELIRSLQQKLQVTSICVTHDMHSAYTIADRIGMLHEGKIIEEGTPKAIRNTQNPIVRQFIEGNTQGPLTENRYA